MIDTLRKVCSGPNCNDQRAMNCAIAFVVCIPLVLAIARFSMVTWARVDNVVNTINRIDNNVEKINLTTKKIEGVVELKFNPDEARLVQEALR